MCVWAWDGFLIYESTKLKNFFGFEKKILSFKHWVYGAKKRFLWAAVDRSTHDSRLLKSCKLYTDTQNHQVLTKAKLDLGVRGKIPINVVGDSAFQKQLWLTKLFTQNNRDPKKVYFNKR